MDRPVRVARSGLRERRGRHRAWYHRRLGREAPVVEQRKFFGLDAPGEHIIPKAELADYQENYSGHEGDFLVAARQHGLDARLVGEMRDAGIRLAIEAEGNPVTDEAWNAGSLGSLSIPMASTARMR